MIWWCQQTRESYKSPAAPRRPSLPFRYCCFNTFHLLALLSSSRTSSSDYSISTSFSKLQNNYIHHGPQESHQRVQEGLACCSRLLPWYVFSDLGPPQHRVKTLLVWFESRTSADSIHIDMIKDAIVNVSRSQPAPGLL